MVECWAGDPARRPPFAEIDRRLQALDYEGARAPNHAEKAKRRREADTQRILSNVFPPHIAKALSQGRRVEPEHHDLVTIFFSDIVGFTDIVSTLSPKKTSDMLDRLYSAFDGLCRELHIFKVETVGDAYMAVTNLVEDQAADHTERIAKFATAASAAAEATLIDMEDPKSGTVRLRIGFHSGPVVANVIGSMNQRFCLFGDTVNTASRMETTSAPGRIHCSRRAATLLAQQSPAISLFARGSIVVKGKGEMETFWVSPKPTPKLIWPRNPKPGTRNPEPATRNEHRSQVERRDGDLLGQYPKPLLNPP
ncbi:nucleotide cyclase [Baffinella frigidus]|nr:nucleotide cyclase [Cryptophyta sp. CCMP2293]